MAFAPFDPVSLDRNTQTKLQTAVHSTSPDATVTDEEPDITPGGGIETSYGGGDDTPEDYGTPAGILKDPWVQRGLAGLLGLALGVTLGKMLG